MGNSAALGVADLVRASDIVAGNVKVNTLFVASLFNCKHGLEELNKEEQEAYEAAGMIDDDIDGILLCKVIHFIDDKAIDWKKIDMKPNNDFKKNINNNTAVAACKDALKLKMIGIGGTDLTKGDKK